jgi:hypothetical protein
MKLQDGVTFFEDGETKERYLTGQIRARKHDREAKIMGKRIFILIDKTDSDFLDKIEAAIRQAEKEKRAARKNLMGKEE